MYYIDEIIKSNDNQKMIMLKNVYEDTLKYLKASDPNKYNEIDWAIYEIVEGKKLTKEKALEWVSSMKPEAKWGFGDIEKLQSMRHIEINVIDFYVLMNMMYTDYFDVVGDDIEKYIKLSLDWYNDKDTRLTGSEKLYCYYKNIVR